jgi:hypothetical protein
MGGPCNIPTMFSRRTSKGCWLGSQARAPGGTARELEGGMRVGEAMATTTTSEVLDAIQQGVLRTEVSSTHVSQAVQRENGGSRTSIPLALVSSVRFAYDVPTHLLNAAIALSVIAVVVFVAGGSMKGSRALFLNVGGNAVFMIAVVLGIFLLVFALISLMNYLSGRKQTLVIASATGKIEVGMPGVDKTRLEHFAMAIETAQARLFHG